MDVGDITSALAGIPYDLLATALYELDTQLRDLVANGDPLWSVCFDDASAANTSSSLLTAVSRILANHPKRTEIWQELYQCVEKRITKTEAEEKLEKLRERNIMLRAIIHGLQIANGKYFSQATQLEKDLRGKDEIIAALQAKLQAEEENIAQLQAELQEEKKKQIERPQLRQTAPSSETCDETHGLIVEFLSKLPKAEIDFVWSMAKFADVSEHDVGQLLLACLRYGENGLTSHSMMQGFTVCLMMRPDMKNKILGIMHHTAVRHSASYRSHVCSADSRTPGIKWPLTSC